MKNAWFIAPIMLAASSLACSIFVGGPSYSETPIPVSTQAVQSLQTQIASALTAGAQTGNVTFQISETQLTSYLAEKLQAEADPLISDPQVLLRDGQMKVYGRAQSGILAANISLTAQMSVDQNGEPQITITQSDFGPLPAPAGLNEAASALVREAFTGALGPVALGFRLQSIDIANGTMTVTGRIR